MIRTVALTCSAAFLAVCVGCQGSASPQAQRPSVRIDPCAERLHDICGQLLLYYSVHNRLPKDLAELQAADGQTMPPLTCPTSGAPYACDADGLSYPGQPGKLLLFDAAPSHGGMRWSIRADMTDGPGPLTLRVLLVPDNGVFSAGRQATEFRPVDAAPCA